MSSVRVAAAWSLLTVGMTVASEAQVTLEPGHALLSPPARLERATSYELILTTGPAERRTGRVLRRFQTVSHMGQEAFLLVQDYRTESGADIDSSWVRASDLDPLEYRARVGEERQSIRFDDGGARGAVVSPESSRTVMDPDAGGAFLSVTEDLVMGSLPLDSGFTAAFRLYNPPRGAAVVEIAVEAVDTLETADGPRQSWRVRYDTGVVSWFWIDACTRDLIRSRTLLPDGSEFWRVRSADVGTWRRTRPSAGT